MHNAVLLPCLEMAKALACSRDDSLLRFLDLVPGLFGVRLYSGECSGLGETWVENYTAMSNTLRTLWDSGCLVARWRRNRWSSIFEA